MKVLTTDKFPSFSRMPALIVGNGISRRCYDINEMKGRLLVFGCNFFMKEYNFEGYPYFLCAQEEPVLRKTTQIGINDRVNVLGIRDKYDVPTKKIVKQLIVTNFDAVKCPIHKSGLNTGQFALLAAKYIFNCYPIFLIGMCDGPEIVDGEVTDNIYPRKPGFVTTSGYRSYSYKWNKRNPNPGIRSIKTVTSKRLNLLQEFQEIIGDCLYFVGKPKKGFKYIEWKSLIKCLPVKYGIRKETIDGVNVFVPVLLNSTDGISFSQTQ